MTSSNPECLDAVSLIVRAADFAAVKHKKQKRKNKEGSPYIVHPLGVARILTEEAGVTDAATIAAAMLHDTVEDTETTLDEIEAHFGSEVRGIVDEVTDDKTLGKNERKEAQVRTAPHKSPKAKLVKLADKLYNLRDIKRDSPVGWTEERCHEYFVWASRVVAGLIGSNQPMEDELIKLFEERDIDVSQLKKK